MNNNANPRKTFAIISHPDAGKTTLTEKLLLFGGAIQQAGAVKARGEARRARSDWMKVEQERGISVASSVMTFDYEGITFNLLDTPGHEDFSEDTYRVLTAVDSAVMVIDSAKGIESQTKKLFEVCRLRNVPIITFINKLDREGLDPFSLLDDIEKTLALDVTPGEPLVVDNEHVVAWEADLEYHIEVASGMFGFTTGEGLVNTFNGSGRVYIQTRNLANLAQAMHPYLPTTSN